MRRLRRPAAAKVEGATCQLPSITKLAQAPASLLPVFSRKVAQRGTAKSRTASADDAIHVPEAEIDEIASRLQGDSVRRGKSAKSKLAGMGHTPPTAGLNVSSMKVLPSNLDDLEPDDLVQLARSRLDSIIEERPRTVFSEVKLVRNLLVAAEEKHAAAAAAAADSQVANSQRASFRSSKRPSRVSEQSLLELAASEQSGALRWIKENFTKFDTDAAEIASSKAAMREQEIFAMADGYCEAVIKAKLMQVNIEKLNVALECEEVSKHLENTRSLEFDTVSFTMLPSINLHPLCPLGAHLVTGKGLIVALGESGRVPDEAEFRRHLLEFFDKIGGLYNDVPYHGVAHAADVMNTLGWLFVSKYFLERMSALDRVLGLAAAAIHDVAHPGVTNAFLEKTQSEFALRYNDKSILENMHVSLGFETMVKHKSCDWFSLLPQEYQDLGDPDTPAVNLQRYARKLLIEMVLATDMTQHATHVRELESIAEKQSCDRGTEVGLDVQSQTRKLDQLDEKLSMMNAGLHAADISNPCKPRAIMLKWTERICAEFWAQGDKERELGQSVSPLCDRETGMRAVPKNQRGFINFVLQPLFRPLAEIVPEASVASQMLRDNEQFWQDLDEKQAQYDDIFQTDGNCNNADEIT